ncbi:MAG: ribosome maturation factor [Balneolaceae bacterium]|nr:ribosome maturation factor [Balneolaceae bacterium]
MFLVDVEIKTGGGQTEVWVYVDAEDRGVSLDECADISSELGIILEAHELFDRKYRLNVSSPGLSRPLVDIRQYRKSEGRVASVKYKSSGEYLKLKGVITGVSDDQVEVTDEDENETLIPFDDIVETKIIPVI